MTTGATGFTGMKACTICGPNVCNDPSHLHAKIAASQYAPGSNIDALPRYHSSPGIPYSVNEARLAATGIPMNIYLRELLLFLCDEVDRLKAGGT
jgi:hypothetical protein